MNPLAPVRHLARTLGYYTDRRARDLADHETAERLRWKGEGLPPGLEVSWLGTAGFALSYEAENVTAAGLYTSLGFVPTGERVDDEVVARRPPSGRGA